VFDRFDELQSSAWPGHDETGAFGDCRFAQTHRRGLFPGGLNRPKNVSREAFW
jgi:hypothetical protein